MVRGPAGVARAPIVGYAPRLVAVSFLTHGAWPGYMQFITGGQAPGVAPYYLTLWLRLPPAIAIVLIGARLGWRWTVVVGATLALPVFYIISWSMLVGVLPFVREAAGRWLGRHGRTLERTTRLAPAIPLAEPAP